MYDIYTAAPAESALFVYNRDLALQGVVEVYGSLIMERALYGVGTWELHTVAGAKGVDLLRIGSIVSLGQSDSRAGVVTRISVDNGRNNEAVTVSGTMLKGLASKRIIVPPTATEDPAAMGMESIRASAEEVLRHYLSLSLITPRDPNRVLPGLAMDSLHDPPRGPDTPWYALHDELLVEVLEEIGEWTLYGWDIRLDLKAKQLVAVVIPPRDLTRGNAVGQPPALFSRDIGNLGGYTYTDDSGGYTNTLYIGGTGEYEEQLVLARSVGVDGKELPALLTGWDRNETWIGAGNINDPERLVEEGLYKHNDRREPLITLDAEIIDTPAYRYGQRWDLGDIVTVYAHPAGQALRLDSQITAVREVYEAGRRMLDVTFGDRQPSLKQELKRLKKDTR